MRGHRFATLILVLGVLLALAGAYLASPLTDSWRSQEDSSRPTTARQWTLVGVFLALAGFLALSLRFSLSFRITLAMTVLSLVVGLYGVEAVLRWRIANQKYLVAKELGYAYDQRTPFEVLMDLRHSGEDAWPSLFAMPLLQTEEVLPIVPLGGISRVTTVHCNENGPYLIYQSDEHGFHNPFGLWDRVGLDVAVLGDSFVHGNCVPAEDSAVARIRAAFPATLSLGIQGNGPLLELAGLKEYLPKLQPKHVVWIFCERNDLTDDLPVENKNPVLRRYLEPGFQQGLIARQEEVDSFWRDRVSALIAERDPQSRGSKFRLAVEAWVRLRTLRRLSGLQVAARKYPDFSGVDLDQFREIMLDARNAVAVWGGKLYFVYLPWQLNLRDKDFACAQEPVRQKILEILDGLQIQVIDLQPVFSQHEVDSLYPFPGSHLSPLGNELLGSAIVDALGSETH